MNDLQDFLRTRSENGLIAWPCQCEAAERFGLSVAEVESAILANDLLPARYQRNRRMLSVAQQRRLFSSRVAVIGAGGLGGYILEQLARLGVGTLVAIDDDTFEENNLNRQLLSSPRRLGQPKVEAAAARIAEINPAVTLEPRQARLTSASGGELLAGADCVVDAVDSVSARLEIEEVCENLRLPLVHGAIAGWYGHVATVLPGDRTLSKIYRHWREGKGIEAQLGNPSFTPALAASLQVSEVCKILLGEGRLLRHRQLVFNVLDMEFENIAF